MENRASLFLCIKADKIHIKKAIFKNKFIQRKRDIKTHLAPLPRPTQFPHYKPYNRTGQRCNNCSSEETVKWGSLNSTAQPDHRGRRRSPLSQVRVFLTTKVKLWQACGTITGMKRLQLFTALLSSWSKELLHANVPETCLKRACRDAQSHFV